MLPRVGDKWSRRGALGDRQEVLNDLGVQCQHAQGERPEGEKRPSKVQPSLSYVYHSVNGQLVKYVSPPSEGRSGLVHRVVRWTFTSIKYCRGDYLVERAVSVCSYVKLQAMQIGSASKASRPSHSSKETLHISQLCVWSGDSSIAGWVFLWVLPLSNCAWTFVFVGQTPCRTQALMWLPSSLHPPVSVSEADGAQKPLENVYIHNERWCCMDVFWVKKRSLQI